MTTVKSYTINDTTYLQRPLVLGQIKQLSEAMAGVEIHAGAGVGDVAVILADRLPRCAAAVLQPEGVAHKDKDLDAMEAEFTEHLDLELVEAVINDFFEITPATVFARLLGRMKGVFAVMRLGVMVTGSMTSSASSPEGTSPSGTPSSGVTP